MEHSRQMEYQESTATDTEAQPAEKRLLHWEKSGPAFRGQLEASLSAQALKATGNVLIALRARNLRDVCRAWPRLLAIAGVKSLGARRYPRAPWAWEEMRDAVEIALCCGDDPYSLHWQEADATLRGYALEVAQGIESRLDRSDVSVESVRSAEFADMYRAFGEGREV